MPQPKPSAADEAAERDPTTLRRDAFWTPTTIEQIAAEQGVRLPQDIDELVGKGADLWESDEDFERFVAGVTERRKAAAGSIS